MTRFDKSHLLIALVAGVIGFVAGNAFWYLASPLWIDRVVSESLSTEFDMNKQRAGTFRDADSSHRGSGMAAIFAAPSGQQLLRFSNFTVTNGPDLKVWLVKASTIQSAADVTAAQSLSLGPLKGNIGDQNYDIPAGTKLDEYKSVVIWCEQFGVLFAAADLLPAT